MTKRRERPVAKFTPESSGSIRVYQDGRIESRFGSGSVVGATAHVVESVSKQSMFDMFGNIMPVGTSWLYLTIEGPTVAMSVALSGQTVREARKFAATINHVSHQTPPGFQPTRFAVAGPRISPGRAGTEGTRMTKRRERPTAKFAPEWSDPLPIRVYQDGRIESRFGSASVIGATARVVESVSEGRTTDMFGKIIPMFTYSRYLTIEGPSVAISAELTGLSGRTVSRARKFAATINQVSHQTPPSCQP